MQNRIILIETIRSSLHACFLEFRKPSSIWVDTRLTALDLPCCMDMNKNRRQYPFGAEHYSAIIQVKSGICNNQRNAVPASVPQSISIGCQKDGSQTSCVELWNIAKERPKLPPTPKERQAPLVSLHYERAGTALDMALLKVLVT